MNVIEPTQEDVDEVDEILEPLGLVDKSREWRKMISGQRLWYFESRDASAWLMNSWYFGSKRLKLYQKNG